ncbi:LysR family transcriptional regulator [Paucibacter sp. TC2R-5]|uniref:LysR family transcriptional regulator n=1 Tax=Paucibacter sp. TC2R-5 TaxID=2893555 RepID=UPI0021E3F53B|nr:LysR family transcriptional regulator [Paucibacter sp. TC2R-5]MCV2359887.1 LysR family transcriptional regulator [Paucibacter sp. TC2R-5]
MRALNLDQLRTLVAIADLGTFAAAAQALHLAAPTVSLHISELESRLDATLLLRGKRGAQLTSAGQVLVQRGRALLRDAEAAIELVARHARGRAGKVRLATQTGVLVYLLPQVLARLKEVHPEIEVEVAVLGTHHTLAALREGRQDLGLVTLPLPPDHGQQSEPWRSDPVLAYLPPDWDAPDEVTPAWLADKPLILNESSTQMYRHTMAWFGQAGFNPVTRIELNYTEAIKSMVVAGYGASVMPQDTFDAPQVLSLHERMQLRPLLPAMTRELVLVYPEPALMAPAALPVLEMLREFAQA